VNAAYSGDVIRLRSVLLGVPLALLTIAPVYAAGPRSHSVSLGAVRLVPYSVEGDPQGAQPDETKLRVRPLVVDGKAKDWTTGELHEVTDRSFVVRRAVRLNDALPTDHGEHWVWQRGPWVMIDRASGKITALHLPDYEPGISEVVWFRDLAAYCGLSASGKQLYAVVAQLAARKPLLSKKLGDWDPIAHPTPACGAAVWQRQPLQISFTPTNGATVSFDLVGSSAVLVEDGDPPDSGSATGASN
jgi:hypothetical protein